MRYHRSVRLLGAGLLALAGACAGAGPSALPGENPHPVRLRRPARVPLSAMAQLGRSIFHDASLSSSARLSCSSCHSPQHHYGPPNDDAVMSGGPGLTRQGARAVPSIAYLEREPSFSIGPEQDEDDRVVDLAQMAALAQKAARAKKSATHTARSALNTVPQGGLFWDGRADTLQQQALGPMLDPDEMDGGSVEAVAVRLRKAPYAAAFTALFGPAILDDPRLLVSEATFAVARFQIEDSSFHPYTSKFDYWLEGRARLSESELRGLSRFRDPDKGNCGACHVSEPTRDGLPPLFTDHQYEALGAPRNAALAGNRDPAYYDLGICGPIRKQLSGETQYCGMFATPTLRNVATRRVFFHNGVFTSLRQVLDFYNFRDTRPGKIYPRGADGTVQKFNDLPGRYRANVDIADPPFDRHRGEAPPMTAQDEADIIAFLGTLTDGYGRQRSKR